MHDSSQIERNSKIGYNYCIIIILMRKGIYKDKKRNTWFIATKVKIGEDFKTFTKRGYLTARDADNDYDRAVNEFVKENEPHCKVIFFDDLIEQYREFRARTVRLQTERSDISIYSKYFKDFNKKLIKDVYTVECVNGWFNKLTKREDIIGQRKNKVITRFKDVLKFAYMKEYIDAPTYQKIDISVYKVKASKKPCREKVAWTMEELNRFFSVIDPNDKYYVLFKVMWHLGCRIGELQGLQWQDFDPITKKIHIQRQVIEGTGQNTWTVSEDLKTECSERYDKLTDDIVELLKEYKESCGNPKPNDFLFFGDRPISRNSIRRRMYEYIEKAGVRKTTPHGARHSNATWLMEQCNTIADVKVAAGRLGHSVSMMTETYGHILNSSEDDMINSISVKEKKLQESKMS